MKPSLLPESPLCPRVVGVWKNRETPPSLVRVQVGDGKSWGNEEVQSLALLQLHNRGCQTQTGQSSSPASCGDRGGEPDPNLLDDPELHLLRFPSSPFPTLALESTPSCRPGKPSAAPTDQDSEHVWKLLRLEGEYQPVARFKIGAQSGLLNPPPMGRRRFCVGQSERRLVAALNQMGWRNSQLTFSAVDHRESVHFQPKNIFR